MGTLHRLLWLTVFFWAMTETEARAQNCMTDAWGHYRCPDGFYWDGAYDWGWEDYHHWRQYHGWGHHSYHDWHPEWRWGFYRPTMSWDYYTYAIIDGRPVHRWVATGGSAKPQAEDKTCDQAKSAFQATLERLKLDSGSAKLQSAAGQAQERMMSACVPPWMQRAAGLGEKQPVPDSGAAL